MLGRSTERRIREMINDRPANSVVLRWGTPSAWEMSLRRYFSDSELTRPKGAFAKCGQASSVSLYRYSIYTEIVDSGSVVIPFFDNRVSCL